MQRAMRAFTFKVQEAVQAIVTVMLAAALIYGFVKGTVSDEAFVGIAGMVIAFWFRGNGSSTPAAPPPPPPPPA